MTEKNKKNLPIDKAEYDALVKQCLKIIEEANILFITDLIAFLPISRATFYNYGLDKLDILKDAINKQRIITKQGLRAKWFQSKSPALQIALYKMIATKEEKEAISNVIFPPKEQEEKTELPIKQMFESLKKSMKEQSND